MLGDQNDMAVCEKTGMKGNYKAIKEYVASIKYMEGR